MSKIKINKDALHKALLTLNVGVPSKALVPAEDLFRFDILADKGKCYVTISNFKVQMRAFVSCEADEDCSFAVPTYLTENTVRNFPDGELLINTVINKETEKIAAIQLRPDGKKNKYKITCQDVEGFMNWPKIEEDEMVAEFKTSMPEFNKNIGIIASNTDPSDPTECYRNLVFLSVDGKLKLISGNPYIICGINTDIPFDAKVIVPHELSKYISTLTETGECHVKITRQRIFIDYSGVKIQTKMVDGNLPDYQKIFNTEPEHMVKISKDSLFSALKMHSAFVREEAAVLMNCTGDVISLFSSNSFGDEAEEDLECENTGKDFQTKLKCSAVKRAIGHIPSDFVEIKTIGGNGIVFIKPEAQDSQIWSLAPFAI